MDEVKAHYCWIKVVADTTALPQKAPSPSGEGDYHESRTVEVNGQVLDGEAPKVTPEIRTMWEEVVVHSGHYWPDYRPRPPHGPTRLENFKKLPSAIGPQALALRIIEGPVEAAMAASLVLAGWWHLDAEFDGRQNGGGINMLPYYGTRDSAVAWIASEEGTAWRAGSTIYFLISFADTGN